jgi:hypothetical protein
MIGGMDDKLNQQPNPLREVGKILVMGVLVVGVALLPYPWDLFLAGTSAVAVLTVFGIRWLNRRDDPRLAKRPRSEP